MPALQTMEIDFEIHQLVEAERRSFSEPRYLALRRLLKLPEIMEDPNPQPIDIGEGRDWVDGNVRLPHGTLFRVLYGRGTQKIVGFVMDAMWVINDNVYSSPSAAASAQAVTKKGTNPSLNGWKYVEVMLRGTNEWVSLDTLRRQSTAEKAASSR